MERGDLLAAPPEPLRASIVLWSVREQCEECGINSSSIVLKIDESLAFPLMRLYVIFQWDVRLPVGTT